MNYRREIDGLRALAVLPVILFHAGFKSLSGGFVGVDIFFVISGYLITSIILSEKQAGTFSFTNFYERRARRILPPLFLVMLACLPLAYLWLMPDHMEEFSRSLIYVPLFVSNMFFLKQSGYFDVAVELKPLLHTWSLAVEEQYYLFFPIILLLIWRLPRRWKIGFFLVIALISLGLAQFSFFSKSASFFILPTRFWELLIGVLAAFYLTNESYREALSSKLANLGSFIGLALILYSVFFLTKDTPYPSFYTLLPTVGTAFIILFTTPKTFAGRLLSTRLLVGIGLISYSAYLWHQPLFAFARYRSVSEPTSFMFLGLSLITLFLAYISWRYIEKPFRDRSRVSRKQILAFAFSGSFIFIALGYYMGEHEDGLPNRFAVSKEVKDYLTNSNVNVTPDCVEVNNKVKGINLCLVGNAVDKAPKVALFGDSHAGVMLPAFDQIGKKIGGSVAYIAGFGGCPPLIDVYVLNGMYEASVCNELAQTQLDYVRNHKDIKKIFLAARWTIYTDGDYAGKGRFFLGVNKDDKLDKYESRKTFEISLKKTIRKYKELGVKVYIIAQVPQQISHVGQLYYSMADRNLDDIQAAELIRRLSVPLSKHHELQSYTRNLFAALATTGEINLIDLDALFCDDSVCILGKSNRPYYSDHDHLTAIGSNLAIDQISEFIKN
ncbi:MAG: acyltransferase family protein [Methylobacter sp.]